MNAQRTNELLINGFRAIDNRRALKINPTPTATPANTTNGILEDKYLNPSKIRLRRGLK